MGQAKSRGSKEDRISAALARQEALKPSEMICNECEAVIAAEHIQLQTTRGLAGLEMVCGAICPQCNSTTLGFKGTEEAVFAATELMQQEHRGAIPALQHYKLNSK